MEDGVPQPEILPHGYQNVSSRNATDTKQQKRPASSELRVEEKQSPEREFEGVISPNSSTRSSQYENVSRDSSVNPDEIDSESAPNRILCSNDCGKVFESRRELERHLDEECPLTVVGCEFKHVGCPVRLPRRALPTHLGQAVVLHLSQQTEKYEERMKLLEADNERLAIKYKRLEIDHKELEKKVSEMSTALRKLTSQSGVLNGAWYASDDLSLYSNERVNRSPQLMMVTRTPTPSANFMARRSTTAEPRLGAADEQYSNADAIHEFQKNFDYSYVITCKSQSSSPMPLARPLSQIELTLTNFEQHQLNDDHWVSQPFFTHPQGYMMCLRVTANGQGSGKGTHITVGVYLMKGEFDDQLEWPFRGDITIQLLNQEGESEHFTKIIHGAKGERGEGNVGEKFISAWGISQFILHSELSPKYLKDDSLKFQVSVAIKQLVNEPPEQQLVETEV